MEIHINNEENTYSSFIIIQQCVEIVTRLSQNHAATMLANLLAVAVS